MPTRINYSKPVTYPEGEEKFVLDCVDKIIIQSPEFLDFLVSDVTQSWQDRRVTDKTREIRVTMDSLGYIEVFKGSRIKLTSLGREVKDAGGHYRYIENQKEVRNKRELQLDSFFTDHSNIAKSFAQQDVLLAQLSEQIYALSLNEPEKETFKKKVVELVKDLGVKFFAEMTAKSIGL